MIVTSRDVGASHGTHTVYGRMAWWMGENRGGRFFVVAAVAIEWRVGH